MTGIPGINSPFLFSPGGFAGVTSRMPYGRRWSRDTDVAASKQENVYIVYLVFCNPYNKDVLLEQQGELASRQRGMAADAATVLLPALNGGVPERKGNC